jgi:hypothetical protein
VTVGIRPRSVPTAARNAEMRLQIVLLDNPVGPCTGHQRVLADGGSARFAISAINTSNARLPRLTIGPELAGMRQHSKTTELCSAMFRTRDSIDSSMAASQV